MVRTFRKPYCGPDHSRKKLQSKDVAVDSRPPSEPKPEEKDFGLEAKATFANQVLA